MRLIHRYPASVVTRYFKLIEARARALAETGGRGCDLPVEIDLDKVLSGGKLET